MAIVTQHSSNFFAGIGGSLAINGVIVAFIKEWSIDVTTEVYGAPTFKSPVRDGLAWDIKTYIGLSEAKVELTGYALQVNASDVWELAPGIIVSLSLIVNEAAGIVIPVPAAVVQSISYSQDATGTSPVEFKASLEVHGAVNL